MALLGVHRAQGAGVSAQRKGAQYPKEAWCGYPPRQNQKRSDAEQIETNQYDRD
jgi:hypothetical protein